MVDSSNSEFPTRLFEKSWAIVIFIRVKTILHYIFLSSQARKIFLSIKNNRVIDEDRTIKFSFINIFKRDRYVRIDKILYTKKNIGREIIFHPKIVYLVGESRFFVTEISYYIFYIVDQTIVTFVFIKVSNAIQSHNVVR